MQLELTRLIFTRTEWEDITIYEPTDKEGGGWSNNSLLTLGTLALLVEDISVVDSRRVGL